MYDRIDFSGWDWQKFEDFVSDLLPLLGFREVVLLGADAPGLDIIAAEDRRTILGTVEIVRWGVQIKAQARPSSFEDIQKAVIAAAEMQVREVLWISLKESRHATRGQVERYVDVSYQGNIKVHYASERRLRRLVLEHPTLLEKYFGLGRPEISAEVERLMSGNDGGLDAFSTADLGAVIATLKEQTPVAPDAAPSVIQMRYETTITPIPRLEASDLFGLSDRVTYIQTGSIEPLVRFVFTLYQPLFDESLIARNEYTWRINPSVPLTIAQQYISVDKFEINGIPVPLQGKHTIEDRLEFVFDTTDLQKGASKPFFVHYVVNNIHPATSKRIFSILHEPCFGYEFALDLTGLGPSAISSLEFLPTHGTRITSKAPGRIRLRLHGVAPARSGLVLTW